MINYLLVVHGEQSVTMHRPMPTEAAITADSRIIGAYDKGPGKGAVIYTETTLTLDGGEKLATLVGSTFARGTAASAGPSEGAPEPHKTPGARADMSVDIPTAAGPGADLPAERRPQPAAQRPGRGERGGVPAADPARAVHLRDHLPGGAADRMRTTTRRR
jgi:hypothetical protein